MSVLNVGSDDSGQEKKRLCEEGILEEYLRYSSYQESPMDFHMWVCISLIAISMGRKCYVNWGAWETYPNLYIILVGESAITHKSTAIRMGMKPLAKALPKLHGTANKMSPEALVRYMSTLSKDEGEAVAYLNISELSVLLGKQKLDDSLIKLLTDLWDSDDIHTSFTIGRGEEVIRNICLNMIAGSTPDWLKNSIPTESLEGGFFSRLILVQRPHTGVKNARPMMNQKQADSLQKVIHDLQQVNKLEGPFHITGKAEEAFDQWYYNHNHPEKAESFMRGYYGRKGDFVIKLAMIFSASLDDEMIIDEDHITVAIRVLDENEEFTKNIVKFMGTTEDGVKALTVLKKIKNSVVTREKRGSDGVPVLETVVGIDHSKLLRQLQHKYRSIEIGEIIDGLCQGGEIDKIQGMNNKSIYVYKGKGLED